MKSEEKAKQQAIERLKASRKAMPDIRELANQILAGNLKALSQGITLVESIEASGYQQAFELTELLYPHSGKAHRLGITGVPGVGKSTFIEAFGLYLVEKGHKVAVLAIDPSSQKTGGSILGDKTRMEQLSRHKNAFIRPSPAAESLGGVARATREAMILCEAAGFDIILIETVGVGQSETAVHSMTDFFLLLMLAGAGDELQGIKRGIMEMADAIAITKADGDNVRKAKQAEQAYKNALHLFPPQEDGWIPRVTSCSALHHEGLEHIYELFEEHHRKLTISGALARKREQQSIYWFHTALSDLWRAHLLGNETLRQQQKQLEQEVGSGHKSPFAAAQELIKSLQQT